MRFDEFAGLTHQECLIWTGVQSGYVALSPCQIAPSHFDAKKSSRVSPHDRYLITTVNFKAVSSLYKMSKQIEQQILFWSVLHSYVLEKAKNSMQSYGNTFSMLSQNHKSECLKGIFNILSL